VRLHHSTPPSRSGPALRRGGALQPRPPCERVKSDQRDAMLLARLARSGDLSVVRVPDAADESMRDLVSAREDAVREQCNGRHCLKALLLRNGVPYAGKSALNITSDHTAFRTWEGPSSTVSIRRCGRDTWRATGDGRTLRFGAPWPLNHGCSTGAASTALDRERPITVAELPPTTRKGSGHVGLVVEQFSAISPGPAATTIFSVAARPRTQNRRPALT